MKNSLSEIYTSLIQQMSDVGLFILDSKGIMLSWNPGVEKLFGYTESEWIGQSGELIFTSEDRMTGVFQAEMKTALETGQAADVRWHLRKDGRRIFVDGILLAVQDETGAILCLARLMQDATPRHTLHQSLRSIEERFRLAQKGAALGIWDWDILTDRIYASETYFQLLGMAPQAEPLSFAQWLSL